MARALALQCKDVRSEDRRHLASGTTQLLELEMTKIPPKVECYSIADNRHWRIRGGNSFAGSEQDRLESL